LKDVDEWLGKGRSLALSYSTWKTLQLARRLGPVQTVSGKQGIQGSSVTKECIDCITGITNTNKIVHRLLSRIICVVIVIEPIHSIAYIHHPATPTITLL
jgi:hypothetical protein